MRNTAFVVLISMIVINIGCTKEQPQTRSAPAPATSTEPAQPSSQPAAPQPKPDAVAEPAAEHAVDSGTRYRGDGISWATPDGWTTVPSSGMRIGSIKPDDGSTEIAVTQLGANFGGLQANIDRWRGQVGLPPTSDLSADVTDVKAGEHDAKLADLAGPGGRMLALILIDEDRGRSYFFKMTAEPDVTQRHKPAFMQVVQSIRLD